MEVFASFIPVVFHSQSITEWKRSVAIQTEVTGDNTR